MLYRNAGVRFERLGRQGRQPCRNYPVYLWDGPRVGRADWGCQFYTYVPEFYDHWNFVSWNFSPDY